MPQRAVRRRRRTKRTRGSFTDPGSRSTTRTAPGRGRSVNSAGRCRPVPSHRPLGLTTRSCAKRKPVSASPEEVAARQPAARVRDSRPAAPAGAGVSRIAGLRTSATLEHKLNGSAALRMPRPLARRRARGGTPRDAPRAPQRQRPGRAPVQARALAFCQPAGRIPRDWSGKPSIRRQLSRTTPGPCDPHRPAGPGTGVRCNPGTPSQHARACAAAFREFRQHHSARQSVIMLVK